MDSAIALLYRRSVLSRDALFDFSVREALQSLQAAILRGESSLLIQLLIEQTVPSHQKSSPMTAETQQLQTHVTAFILSELFLEFPEGRPEEQRLSRNASRQFSQKLPSVLQDIFEHSNGSVLRDRIRVAGAAVLVQMVSSLLRKSLAPSWRVSTERRSWIRSHKLSSKDEKISVSEFQQHSSTISTQTQSSQKPLRSLEEQTQWLCTQLRRVTRAGEVEGPPPWRPSASDLCVWIHVATAAARTCEGLEQIPSVISSTDKPNVSLAMVECANATLALFAALCDTLLGEWIVAQDNPVQPHVQLVSDEGATVTETFHQSFDPTGVHRELWSSVRLVFPKIVERVYRWHTSFRNLNRPSDWQLLRAATDETRKLVEDLITWKDQCDYADYQAASTFASLPQKTFGIAPTLAMASVGSFCSRQALVDARLGTAFSDTAAPTFHELMERQGILIEEALTYSSDSSDHAANLFVESRVRLIAVCLLLGKWNPSDLLRVGWSLKPELTRAVQSQLLRRISKASTSSSDQSIAVLVGSLLRSMLPTVTAAIDQNHQLHRNTSTPSLLDTTRPLPSEMLLETSIGTHESLVGLLIPPENSSANDSVSSIAIDLLADAARAHPSRIIPQLCNLLGSNPSLSEASMIPGMMSERQSEELSGHRRAIARQHALSVLERLLSFDIRLTPRAEVQLVEELLNRLEDEELQTRLSTAHLFARVSPEQSLPRLLQSILVRGDSMEERRRNGAIRAIQDILTASLDHEDQQNLKTLRCTLDTGDGMFISLLCFLMTFALTENSCQHSSQKEPVNLQSSTSRDPLTVLTDLYTAWCRSHKGKWVLFKAVCHFPCLLFQTNPAALSEQLQWISLGGQLLRITAQHDAFAPTLESEHIAYFTALDTEYCKALEHCEQIDSTESSPICSSTHNNSSKELLHVSFLLCLRHVQPMVVSRAPVSISQRVLEMLLTSMDLPANSTEAETRIQSNLFLLSRTAEIAALFRPVICEQFLSDLLHSNLDSTIFNKSRFLLIFVSSLLQSNIVLFAAGKQKETVCHSLRQLSTKQAEERQAFVDSLFSTEFCDCWFHHCSIDWEFNQFAEKSIRLIPLASLLEENLELSLTILGRFVLWEIAKQCYDPLEGELNLPYRLTEADSSSGNTHSTLLLKPLTDFLKGFGLTPLALLSLQRAASECRRGNVGPPEGATVHRLLSIALTQWAPVLIQTANESVRVSKPGQSSVKESQKVRLARCLACGQSLFTLLHALPTANDQEQQQQKEEPNQKDSEFFEPFVDFAVGCLGFTRFGVSIPLLGVQLLSVLLAKGALVSQLVKNPSKTLPSLCHQLEYCQQHASEERHQRLIDMLLNTLNS